MRLRSILLRRVLDPRKKSRSPWKCRRAVNGFTSIEDACVGISVLKGGCARSSHEFTGSKRLIFAEIAVYLPAAKAATGIHDFPPSAVKNLLHRWRLRLDDCAATQSALAQFCRGGIPVHQDAASARRMRSESKRTAAVVPNVMTSVNGRHDSAEPLLFYRAQKIA